MSASITNEDIKKGLDAGADVYQSKPIKKFHIDQIDELLRKRDANLPIDALVGDLPKVKLNN